MDQNLPIIAKKFWNLVRVLYLVLRKEISKRKLLLHLNFTFNKSKLADKLAAFQNLVLHHIYHHHHQSSASAATNHHVSEPPIKKYKVQSPAHPIFHLPINLKKHKRHHAPPPPPTDADDVFVEAFQDVFHSAAASPAFPGFWKSPVVRQVRVTDSPYTLSDVDQESSVSVNEAAEEFIMKFYKNLRHQNRMAY